MDREGSPSRLTSLIRRRTDFQSVHFRWDGLVIRPTSILPIRSRRHSVEQALLQYRARLIELRLPGDLRTASGKAIPNLFQRVASHVRALVARTGDAGNRMISVPGI